LSTGGHGPEDVVFDDRGRVVTGLAGGSIVAIDPSSGTREMLGNTGGRPLGVQPCRDGSVLVCDHDRGLLRVLSGGSVDVLADSIDGERLTFASNVVQGRDGTIWFTTSTSRWDLEHYEGDIFEHSCTGRLARYDADGTVTVLVSGLAFGNGLVLAPDESHLLYAESAAYSITRYWLAGRAAGSTEPFAPNLPGFPDNMSLGSDGLLWVSIAAPRNALLDALLPRPGVLRTLVWNLPDAVRPKPTPIAWVMAFDLNGNLVHDLRLTGGGYGFVTSVAERDGTLVLGSLHADDIAVARKE
jgi:sugar lactone lactonase YvrE